MDVSSKNRQVQSRYNVIRSGLTPLSEWPYATSKIISACDGKTTIASSSLFKEVGSRFLDEDINRPSESVGRSSASIYRVDADFKLSDLFYGLNYYEIFPSQHQLCHFCDHQSGFLRQEGRYTIFFVVKDNKKIVKKDNVFIAGVYMTREGIFADYFEPDNNLLLSASEAHRIVLNRPISPVELPVL